MLAATVAVAQLHILYVEYSAMCNCASREVRTGLFLDAIANEFLKGKAIFEQILEL